MSTIVRRSTTAFRRLHAAAFLLAFILTTVAPVLGGNTKLVCGKPTKTGPITVILIIQKGAVRDQVTVTVPVDSSWSAEDKASWIRGRFWTEVDTNLVQAVGFTDTVKFEGQNGWVVQNVAVGTDGSEEPDEFALGIPVPEQEALCSLARFASGEDIHGAPGLMKLRVGGMEFTQQTQPGMPSSTVEQMLIAQMNAAGIPAHFATAADFEGYEGLPHDERVIWFPILDTTGFREELTDTGLLLDLASIMDGTPDAPAGVPIDTGATGLRLDVFPSLLSRGGVSVRYSARAGEGSVRLDVFDVMGRRQRTLLESGPAIAGALSWDGRDERNALLPGGVYFVRLATPHGGVARRVTLVRE